MTGIAPPNPQGAMAQLVIARIKVHPLLQPVRDAGYPVLIGCCESAICAQAIPRGAGEYELEKRIDHPGWFVPVLDSSEDWAWKLANRLAKGIRKQWDARVGGPLI